MSTAPALAYHAGGLGDFVLSLPALVRLAAARPDAVWHYWGPRERLALLPGWAPPPPELLRSEGSLWGARPAPTAAGWLGGTDRVAAFAAAPPPWLPASPQGVWVRPFPREADPRVWVPRYQSQQLDAAGVPRGSTAWLPPWRQRVLPVHPGGRLLLHPGSGDPAKNLPAATWRAAVECLEPILGWEPLVLAGPVEQERGAGVAWPWERRGCATLPELLGVLAGTSLLLGNDSGVAHLAGLLGIPTVVVFGPSDPVRWKPQGSRVAVVETRRKCAPCSVGPPIRCQQPACMQEITPERVAAAARRLVG